jgi:surface polysaccharide O-acyltransferase-like enzyme
MQKNYNPAVDLLRIFSILAVVLIHTSTRILESTHMDLIHHQGSLLLNQISRFAVPLFFMISGFVLELSYKNNFLDYLKKRISKIFVPYLFWSALYYFFIYTKHSDNFFQAILSGSASYQLYFIPALLVLYLLFPLLHKLYSLFANKLVLLILILAQTRLLYLDYHLQGLNIYYPLNIAALNFLVFVLGMMAFVNQEQLLKIAKRVWPLLIPTTIAAGLYVFKEGLKNYYATYNFQYYYSQNIQI